jgi:iron complex transport system substrate-binding protein
MKQPPCDRDFQSDVACACSHACHGPAEAAHYVCVSHGPATAGHYLGALASVFALAWAATTVFAAAPPMRIVSTSPSITETLFALGLGARVVGVSSFCRYPAEAESLPRIGSYLRPDTELIARLRPDLVVINAGPNEVQRQLTSMGLRAITVAPGSLDSVYSTIQTVGEAAGVRARADMLVGDLRHRLDRIHKAVAGRPRKRVLVIVGRRTGTLSDLIAVGSRSYLGELVDVAGGVNVLSGDRLPEYPRISMETVIRLAPDVVVDAADMGDALEHRRRKQPETEAMWRREAAVAAVRAGAVHVVTSDAFLVPGPRVIEAAATLAAWLHGIEAR